MSEIKNSNKFTYIDLFAGCGGLSLGLYNAGWHGLFAIEKNPDAFKTLEYNLINRLNHFDWPDWLDKKPHDIDQVLKEHKGDLEKLRDKVDMVTGGPPCQGFSMAGRRKEDDVRNGLIKSYLRFVMHIRPKLIFFENVKGFTQKFDKNKSKGIAYSQYVLRVLRFFGYEVEGRMVNFAKYGLPQKRTRFILVGVRKDIAAQKNISVADFFKQLTKGKKSFLLGRGLPQSPNLGSAISDLLKSNGLIPTPDRPRFFSGRYSSPKSKYQAYLRANCELQAPDSHSFPVHRKNIQERFSYLMASQKANKNISDIARNKFEISKHTIIPLSAKQKTPTITTLPDDYIHYCESRILTVREYARIQGFPDNYEFKGRYTTGGKRRKMETPRYTQIGNAIPPIFSEQAGLTLTKLLC